MKTQHPLKQYIDAFTAGEKVEYQNNGYGGWGPVNACHLFDNIQMDFRIAPKTMKLGNREVPMPLMSDSYMNHVCSITPGFTTPLMFSSKEDRAEFWAALVELVKENQS